MQHLNRLRSYPRLRPSALGACAACGADSYARDDYHDRIQYPDNAAAGQVVPPHPPPTTTTTTTSSPDGTVQRQSTTTYSPGVTP